MCSYPGSKVSSSKMASVGHAVKAPRNSAARDEEKLTGTLTIVAGRRSGGFIAKF